MCKCLLRPLQNKKGNFLVQDRAGPVQECTAHRQLQHPISFTIVNFTSIPTHRAWPRSNSLRYGRNFWLEVIGNLETYRLEENKKHSVIRNDVWLCATMFTCALWKFGITSASLFLVASHGTDLWLERGPLCFGRRGRVSKKGRQMFRALRTVKYIKWSRNSNHRIDEAGKRNPNWAFSRKPSHWSFVQQSTAVAIWTCSELRRFQWLLCPHHSPSLSVHYNILQPYQTWCFNMFHVSISPKPLANQLANGRIRWGCSWRPRMPWSSAWCLFCSRYSKAERERDREVKKVSTVSKLWKKNDKSCENLCSTTLEQIT